MIKNNLNISARAARSARAYFILEHLFDVLCKTTKTIDLLKTSAHDMKRLLLSQYFKSTHASLIFKQYRRMPSYSIFRPTGNNS